MRDVFVMSVLVFGFVEMLVETPPPPSKTLRGGVGDFPGSPFFPKKKTSEK
jgi:hypothetical protein